MFDIKTPRRVYYLAAEGEEDMNTWVDLVCRVCGLHNFTSEKGEGEGGVSGGGEEDVGVVIVPETSMTSDTGGSLTISIRLPGLGTARLLVRFLLYIRGQVSSYLLTCLLTLPWQILMRRIVTISSAVEMT